MWKALVELLVRLWNVSEKEKAVAPESVLGSRDSAPHVDVGQVQELLGRVNQLTASVASDVGQHNKSIEAISHELTFVAQSDPSAVAAIVCKLLVANQELQGRLEHAEGTLQMHSRELCDAMATARTDVLTGLMNRRALDEKLSACVAELAQSGKPSTLFILDVDRFKKFNDTYGHLIGDKCLVHVAGALRSRSTATDFVGRYGGEEFVVVFAGHAAAEVRQRAEMMRRMIGQRPLIIEGCTKPVTASGGLAELKMGETVTDWIKRADAALYAAKDGGRDCTFEMNGKSAEKILLAAPEESQMIPPKEATRRPALQAAAEIAAEAFADTSFVPSVARRIAEWRRGGRTLTVVLARLDCCADKNSGFAPYDQHDAMRIAIHAARTCLREMDLITRWRSNGIAILLPNSSAQDAKSVARRLKNALAANAVDGQASLSMGIAEGIEGNDAKRVLERAWLALDTVCSMGPGGVAVHDGLRVVGIKLAVTAK